MKYEHLAINIIIYVFSHTVAFCRLPQFVEPDLQDELGNLLGSKNYKLKIKFYFNYIVIFFEISCIYYWTVYISKFIVKYISQL